MTISRQGTSARSWRHTQRVLIVDGDPSERKGLNDFFKERQWDVLEASSSREALDILDHRGVDVVFLDTAAQGVDGPEIVRALRQHARDLPVVIMGRLMTPELRRMWRSRGAMDCLVKPIESRTLSALLGALTPSSGFADS
jgi:two-component system cell cycle response regulator